MIKHIPVSCNDKQAKEYSQMIRDYVEMTYQRLDAKNTGDIHIDRLYSEELNKKVMEIGRFVLDHQIGAECK